MKINPTYEENTLMEQREELRSNLELFLFHADDQKRIIIIDQLNRHLSTLNSFTNFVGTRK